MLFDDKFQDECGVVGLFDAAKNASVKLWEGLFALQHRGQESAGIAVVDSKKGIVSEKAMGLVSEAIDDDKLTNLPASTLGIGHVRYSNADENNASNIQPMIARSAGGWIAVSNNGNLINAAQLEQQLMNDGGFFHSISHSEIILSLIVKNLKGATIEEAIIKSVNMLKGAYAFCVLTEKEIIGVRDPLGIRPLALGKFGENGGYCIASESCAFDTMGAEFVRDLYPGEMIIINESGMKSVMLTNEKKSALCIFEYVYIAKPDSIIDGLSVHRARFEMGRELARIAPVEADIIAGIPESALPAARGFAFESGIPYRDALVRNRFVGRTFIQPQQSLRERGVDLKLSALRKSVEGKRVVLVDDSIVRGTTTKRVQAMLRKAGAAEVHLRIASPPVKFPCCYGIDTPTKEELTGACYSVEYIRDMLKADSLEYITKEGLVRAVKAANINMCTACFDGEYPVNPNL